MQGTTQPIDRQTLLEKANKLIREHEDTLAGIEATDVVQRNGVLVFSGEFYLDEQGLPTAKSTAVFNMFKYLAHELSDKYHGGLTAARRTNTTTRGPCLALFCLHQRLLPALPPAQQQFIGAFCRAAGKPVEHFLTLLVAHADNLMLVHQAQQKFIAGFHRVNKAFSSA